MCIIDSLMCRFVCHRIVGSLYCVIKRPLQYNELAKRTPAYGDILAFVDISKYTLKFVSLSVRFQFVEVRWRTLLFSQYVEDVCACRKKFDLCQRTAHTQGVRSLNAIRMFVFFCPQYGNSPVPLRWHLSI